MQYYQSESWKNNSAFECYTTYLALKRHFTTSYDYFKFNGKIKASIGSFESRKDAKLFNSLSKHKEWKELIIANLMIDPNIWVGNLLDANAAEVLLQAKKRQSSLFYTFSDEIKKLQIPFDSNFIPINGQHPLALMLFINGKLSIESMLILEELIHYIKVWDKLVTDPIIWPKKKLLLQKAKPFIELNNLDKCRKKIVDIFSE